MKFVCLSHETPISFFSRTKIYYHILWEHRDCFLSRPQLEWRGKPDDRCKEFICKCGRTGFRNLDDLIKHLNECQDVHIIYQKGILKPRMFTNGIPPSMARELIKKRKTLQDVGSALDLPEETILSAERLAQEYSRACKCARTRAIDAASLYIVSRSLTQREIAEEFGITVVTLRRNYKKLLRWKGNSHVRGGF